MISETKVDDSFPVEGFFTPYRLDNSKIGGILLYVREDTP